MRRLGLTAILIVASSLAAVAVTTSVQAHLGAQQPEVVLYAAPVLASVVDPFRPPAHIGGPGNRGLEYGGTRGDYVSAAADGWVLFAGPVAGRKAITIQHNDGVRTTYTGLAEIWVVRDQYVRRYSAIAVAAGNLHFGARIKNHYLDPQILIDASESTVRPILIPRPD